MPKIIENQIFEYIKKHKIVKSKDIEKIFQLTQSSSRRYLIKLETQGLINRTFGEIILNENKNFQDQKIENKITANLEVKTKIAQYASKLALGYKTIFVDSGSNCYCLLQFLDKDIELFTNSITNANLALELGFQNVNILGGTLKSETKSIVNFNENELADINFPISFLGVNAIDEKGFLYTPEKREAKAKQDIMRRSLITVVLAEKEKFNSKSTFKFSDNDSKIVIISDVKEKDLKKMKLVSNTQIIKMKEKEWN